MVYSRRLISGEPILKKGEHQFLIFWGCDPDNLINLIIDLIYFLLRPLLPPLHLNLLHLHPADGVRSLILHVVLSVLAFLTLAVAIALNSVIVALTVLL